MARLDTRWTIDQPEKLSSWRIGDSISSGLQWTGAVRFAGLQYATNFNTQPSLITFPLPQFRGEATLPSVVDVYLNNSLNYQSPVDRGPFFINQIPVVTGAGNLQITTTDLLGRQQLITLPYYASPILLKRGLQNFSYEGGIIRNNYGIDNYNYGRPFGSGTYSLGISDRYTAGVHAEVLKEQQTFGFNNNYLLGHWGTVSLGSAISSCNRGLGGLLSLGFNRSASILSYGAQATLSTPDYTQIGTLFSQNFPTSTIQAFIGFSLPQTGSIALSYTAVGNAYNQEKNIWNNYLFPDNQIFSLSYSRVILSRFFLNTGIFKDIRNSNNDQLFVTLSMPFDSDKLIGINNQNQINNHQTNIQLTKNLPFGEGYGYQLFAGQDSNYPAQANFTLQRNYGSFTARYANLNHENNYELNARGSFIHFAKHNFPARYVEQSFALVEVPAFKNVAVYSRNQLVGKTNSAGFLYIPETLPYQINEISIDATSLPFNTVIPTTKKITIPYWKSGSLVRFDVSRTQTILLSISLPSGTPIPAGAEVFLENGSTDPLPVGYNGQVFISVMGKNLIYGQARWQNKVCSFKYSLPSLSQKTIKDSVVCSLV